MAIITDKKEDVKTRVPFPCLMYHSKTGVVWLVSSNSSGTVVYAGSSSFSTGYFHLSLNIDTLEKFKGQITLENA